MSDGIKTASLRLARGLFQARQGEPSSVSLRVRNAFSADGRRVVNCKEVAGQLLFEGDIVVTRWTIAERAKRVVSLFGSGVTDAHSLWPGGVIPIAVHHDVRPLVEAAIAEWTTYTPIQFHRFAGERDYLAFHPHVQSGTEVGRQGGKQVVWLRPDTTVGTAIHEIGHAVGLWHEHSRTDRLEYVDIHWENIDSNDVVQFDQPIYNAADIGPYDFDSIMHYPSDAFTANGQPTITAKNGAVIGQRDGLSQGDVDAVRTLYPELAWA